MGPAFSGDNHSWLRKPTIKPEKAGMNPKPGDGEANQTY